MINPPAEFALQPKTWRLEGWIVRFQWMEQYPFVHADRWKLNCGDKLPVLYPTRHAAEMAARKIINAHHRFGLKSMVSNVSITVEETGPRKKALRNLTGREGTTDERSGGPA